MKFMIYFKRVVMKRKWKFLKRTRMLQSTIVGNGNMLKLVYDIVDRKGLMIRILRKKMS